jgi:RNA polymerase sigma-70 factor, ECF subfamily
MSQDSLDEALDEARKGEEWGVVVLFRAFNPGLVGYLRHHVRGHEEDVASEVWASAAKLLLGFDGDARAFRALLFTLARRRTVDHYRRSGRQPAVVDLGEAHDPADGTDLETAVISDLSAQEAIEALLDGLPSTQAEVVLLRVVGDLRVDEVADVLGRSPGSVRVLQHRALQRLAKKFEEVVTR